MRLLIRHFIWIPLRREKVQMGQSGQTCAEWTLDEIGGKLRFLFVNIKLHKSETAIYLRCKNGGQKGTVSMKVCKDAPKVQNVGSSQRLFPEEPNQDDPNFCTVDKKLIPIETVMKNLINPKTVCFTRIFIFHHL